MRCSRKLISGILLSAILSFSAFPQTILANTLDTHANVSLRAVDPSDPNKIRDPYDPDLNYPGDSNDPGNNGTGSVGQLTLDYVSNLRFGTHSIKQGWYIRPCNEYSCDGANNRSAW
ncbi:WxL domain-containing protein [Companilactobacillus mishanensis]|uniref:WxL domain-containing protein n=1 Tax=Companilactobacillus mishanensis TaxID=2486008 RepID=A0A5P0ZKG9_9LACO|nr:WxL domain-containing protein [Companilactobacillus mishanensis]MQS53573.1 hypothetical protein [Companilactobacillus mishanensis]